MTDKRLKNVGRLHVILCLSDIKKVEQGLEDQDQVTLVVADDSLSIRVLNGSQECVTCILNKLKDLNLTSTTKEEKRQSII